MNEIPNYALTETDLPPPYADWDTISQFALTFNGYARWGTMAEFSEVAARVEGLAQQGALASATLSELRGCLFLEQRRWRHYGEVPNGSGLRHIHALVEAIRQKVRAREWE